MVQLLAFLVIALAAVFFIFAVGLALKLVFKVILFPFLLVASVIKVVFVLAIILFAGALLFPLIIAVLVIASPLLIVCGLLWLASHVVFGL